MQPQIIISGRQARGQLAAPPSKSHMQRVLAAALLKGGKTSISHPGNSHDCLAATGITEALGARLQYDAAQNILHMESEGLQPRQDYIDCGESGLSARLFTPVAALSNKPIRITGSGSLRRRPMGLWQELLPQLGVQLVDFNGLIPFTVQGPLQPAALQLDGSLSSQFLSGLLFAFAFSAQKPCSIQAHGLKSRPYTDLSIKVLKTFGRPIAQPAADTFLIDPALFFEAGHVHTTIEGDWSGAAALLVAGALAGEVCISGLDAHSLQADRMIVSVLEQAGARLHWKQPDTLCVAGGQLSAFELDATHCPDLFPVLAILAAACRGRSRIRGLHRLRHKESDRAGSIAQLLGGLGVHFELTGDVLCITGQAHFTACRIPGFGDHRMVMAAALAALRTNGPMTILEPEATVGKSYPDFFKHIQALGMQARLHQTSEP